MTIDTLADLSVAVGRELTNQEWTMLISENFGVSKSVAKDAYHAMLSVISIKKNIRRVINIDRKVNEVKNDA